MKKFLSLALVFVLVLVTLTSCDFLNKLLNKGEETTTTPEETTPPAPTYDIDAAADYLDNLYKEGFKNNPKTTVDFDVVAQIIIDGLTYTVEWTVDSDKVTVGEAKDGKVTINVDEKSPEEVAYVLTATIKAADNSTTSKSYSLIVPAYGLVSWEDYIATEAGQPIAEVQGVVTGIVSKSVGASYNCLFLQDATGGAYYVYGMTSDPITDLNIEIGMTVSVAGGVKDVYNGTHEIKPNEGVLQVTILSEEKTPVTPADYTEIFKNAANMTDAALVTKQSSLVTIKGVEITDQVLENGYLKFKLNGKESYLRISGSTLAFPTANKDAFIAEHAAKKGYTADVTGIISIYSGAFYLVPVSTDAFVYGQAADKTPAEKVESALAGLKTIGSVYNKDIVIELPAADKTYTDVTFTWASNNAAAVVGTDGKLTITLPAEDVEITITVTAKCGDATASKEFKATLSNLPDANTYIDLAQANKIGLLMGHNKYTADKYFVTGEIVDIPVDSKDATKLNAYGNMTIKDENGNTFYLYGLYTPGKDVRFDKMNPQPKVGDTITVYGIVGQYNGTAQMKDAWLVTVPAADEELSLPAANTIGLAQGHNKYTANKVVVTGEITDIASTKYGNMTIKDADGNTLYLYGLYVGETRYDALEVKPVVGDTITVTGILGQYKGTAQIKDSQMTKHTPATPDQGGDNTDTPAQFAGALEITKEDFNSTSYAANNNAKTENGYTYTSNQVMNQQSVMQWQKNTGYIVFSNNEFTKLEIKVIASTFTVTVGGTEVTGTTEGDVTTYNLTGLTGELKISVGSTTGKVDYLRFYK